jgi:hypothetical protein
MHIPATSTTALGGATTPQPLDPRIGPIADAQHTVLTGQQCRDLLGMRGMARALHSGSLARLWHNAYATPPVSLQTRLRAADLTLGPGQVPCLDTAAAVHGFDLVQEERLHLLGEQTGSKRPEIVLHRLTPLRPLVRWNGRRVMDPVETAVRVAAAQQSEQQALAVLDAALASRSVLRAESLERFADTVTLRGIRQVRRVAGWADPLPESPRESWLRWVFLDAGLPAPTLQFWVRLPGRRYRLDLAWPEYKVACEYDGTEFHTGDALYRDRRRLNDLLADHWLMCFATNQMVTADRPHLVGQVRDMLGSRGARL